MADEMRKGKMMGSTFNLQDGKHDGEVKSIPTNSAQYDKSRVKEYSSGSKGYPAEAWNYDY